MRKCISPPHQKKGGRNPLFLRIHFPREAKFHMGLQLFTQSEVLLSGFIFGSESIIILIYMVL